MFITVRRHSYFIIGVIFYSWHSFTPTTIPCQMMVVSFNSSTTDATSGTGIAYLSRDLRTHCFHWVRVAQYLIIGIVFYRPLCVCFCSVNVLCVCFCSVNALCVCFCSVNVLFVCFCSVIVLFVCFCSVNVLFDFLELLIIELYTCKIKLIWKQHL
jgi:hypothetical protein